MQEEGRPPASTQQGSETHRSTKHNQANATRKNVCLYSHLYFELLILNCFIHCGFSIFQNYLSFLSFIQNHHSYLQDKRGYSFSPRAGKLNDTVCSGKYCRIKTLGGNSKLSEEVRASHSLNLMQLFKSVRDSSETRQLSGPDAWISGAVLHQRH